MRLWQKDKKLTFEETIAAETAAAEAALTPLERSKRLAFKIEGINWWPPGKEPAFMQRAWQAAAQPEAE